MRFSFKGGLLIMAIIASTSSGAAAADGWKKKAGTYAVFDTSLGTIVCRLFPEQAPVTVDNFVGLAEGTKEFLDAKTGAKAKRPYYDGLVFHRVIPRFMIQGGCPLGIGNGGPGYKFKDEFAPGLDFKAPGKLAMANAGPATNGSQFFITVNETDYLTGAHTIFGEVVQGQDVAEKIANTPVNNKQENRPVTPVVIKKLSIERVK